MLEFCILSLLRSLNCTAQVGPYVCKLHLTKLPECYCRVLVQRMATSSSSSQVSYDELIRQVHDLQKENTHLRRELLGHSSTSIRHVAAPGDDSLAPVNAVSDRDTVDAAAAAAAGDVAMSDCYSSPRHTLMPSSDLAFHSHSHCDSSHGKFYRL